MSSSGEFATNWFLIGNVGFFKKTKQLKVFAATSLFSNGEINGNTLIFENEES